MSKGKETKRKDAVERDKLKKGAEVEIKDGVRWIYHTSPKPEHDRLGESIECTKDVYAEYECESCGRIFHESFDYTAVPERIHCRPICSSMSVLNSLRRLIHGKSRGVGRLKEVEVFKQYLRGGSGI